MIEFQRWNLYSSRQRVVHKCAGEELPILIIAQLFIEDPAETLSDPAMKLALDQKRVNHYAAVMHGDIAKWSHDSGFGINFDNRHTGCIGIRGVGVDPPVLVWQMMDIGHTEVTGRLQPRFHIQGVAVIGMPVDVTRHLVEGDFFIGLSFNPDAALLALQFLWRGLQHAGRYPDDLIVHLARSS